MTVSPWTVGHICLALEAMSSSAQALKTFGKSLQGWRKKRGLTQETLAGLCGYDPTYISLLERGKRNPALATIVILAKNLGCKVKDLVVDV